MNVDRFVTEDNDGTDVSVKLGRSGAVELTIGFPGVTARLDPRNAARLAERLAEYAEEAGIIEDEDKTAAAVVQQAINEAAGL